ncbi:hypothetical protein BDQ17DRAFT_1372056 [Cyathus striatus]|nr:hypothetical protein BDQ17DRAFT_1372056 [Cyathus striatus]
MVSRILGVLIKTCVYIHLPVAPLPYMACPQPSETYLLQLHASSSILYRMTESCSAECYDSTS